MDSGESVVEFKRRNLLTAQLSIEFSDEEPHQKCSKYELTSKTQNKLKVESLMQTPASVENKRGKREKQSGGSGPIAIEKDRLQLALMEEDLRTKRLANFEVK